MEAQVEQAIEIAFDTVSKPDIKQQAFEYLQQLRNDALAWQTCAALFIRVPRTSEVVRVVALDIVNNAVETQSLDGENLRFLKDTLLNYIRTTYDGSNPDNIDTPGLQNKIAQTLTYLFVSLYKQGWESFIDDFSSLTYLPNSGHRDNFASVVLYLRLLGSVHDEIADTILSRQSHSDPKRNAALKDLIRERDMVKVARSWQDLLSQYGDQNDYILEMTLKVIGKWVGWIDISLVLNQEMLNLLFPLVGRLNPTGGDDKVRDAAIDAFTEIVAKKMKPVDKTEMISFLNLRDIIQQLVASPPLHEFQRTPKYDTDLAEAVAKLVNNVVSDIVRILEDGQVDNDTRARAEQQLMDFLPLLLRFFSDEYDEVCSTVIPALTDLLTFLRKVQDLPSTYREMLSPILNAIVMKMRYDETATWGGEDDQTDEAEFMELRKRLQNLQRSVAAVDQDIYMNILSNLVANTFQTLAQQGSSMDWRDIDLALHELYLFGELALPNQTHLQGKTPSDTAVERLAVVMQKMVESGIAQYPHPAIILQYMENCNRYCQFFENHKEYIPGLLENFVRLIHHDHPRIRLRSWYLFQRVIKQLRAHLGDYAEGLIQSIGDLLPIKAEVPGDDADDDMSSDESDHSADAIFNGQLYLFEAAGCIASTPSLPVEKQALFARSVMNPLFSDMEQHLQRARAGDVQAILQIHHIIMALGSLAHGFLENKPTSGPSSTEPAAGSICDEFLRVAEAILIALGELNTNGEIRAACRTAFSRLLAVLGAVFLPQLPQWIAGLLSQSSKQDEMAFFLRTLNQVVFRFKQQIFDVLNVLLIPLLQRILSGLSEPVFGTDDEIQLIELRREYLSFLQVIFNNNLEGVFVSGTNQGFFDTMIGSIISLARTTTHGNLVSSRYAFAVLNRMTTAWGGPDVAKISENPAAPTGPAAPSFPGFDRFVIERFHPVCWEVLVDPQFRPAKDAQSKQVLLEIAQLEQSIYTKTGEAFLNHLQTTLFPQLGIDGTELLRAMTTSVDRKAFTSCLQNFHT